MKKEKKEKARDLEYRAISPAIATIGLISVAIAASIPAISQLQTQVRSSAPDAYAVNIDIVKLSDARAWFYVSQSESRYICINILHDDSTWGPLFCTADRTFVTTADIEVNIGDRYSVGVELHDDDDEEGGDAYASKTVSVIVR